MYDMNTMYHWHCAIYILLLKKATCIFGFFHWQSINTSLHRSWISDTCLRYAALFRKEWSASIYLKVICKEVWKRWFLPYCVVLLFFILIWKKKREKKEEKQQLHVNFNWNSVSQLKSSLLLHIDGTSPVAEDIGRQVIFCWHKNLSKLLTSIPSNLGVKMESPAPDSPSH